jgi:hypothetical protein
MSGEQFYAALLRLYPRRFREEYGDEMQAAFAQMYAHRRRHALGFWCFVVVDALWSVAHERIDVLRWLATSLIGLAVTIVTAHGGLIVFRYFYHPFFDGVVVPAWICGIGLGLALGGSVAIAQRILLPLALRHPRSWALASAIALPVAILFCSAVIERVVVGLNPVATAPSHVSLLGVLNLGPDDGRNWGGLITQFVAMSFSAFIVRALAVRRRLERRHAH